VPPRPGPAPSSPEPCAGSSEGLCRPARGTTRRGSQRQRSAALASRRRCRGQCCVEAGGCIKGLARHLAAVTERLQRRSSRGWHQRLSSRGMADRESGRLAWRVPHGGSGVVGWGAGLPVMGRGPDTGPGIEGPRIEGLGVSQPGWVAGHLGTTRERRGAERECSGVRGGLGSAGEVAASAGSRGRRA
jgi:hypothetical protein